MTRYDDAAPLCPQLTHVRVSDADRQIRPSDDEPLRAVDISTAGETHVSVVEYTPKSKQSGGQNDMTYIWSINTSAAAAAATTTTPHN